MDEKLKPLPFRFWRALSGSEPVRDWLNELDVEDRRAIGQDLARVQYGWPLGMPLCRSLGHKLWEVRSSLTGGREARVVFCFDAGAIIALHGFMKKSQKTPAAELEKAVAGMKELQR